MCVAPFHLGYNQESKLSQEYQPQRAQSITSVTDSMNDIFANILSRGNSAGNPPDPRPTAKSPSVTRSPTGSKVSSRRESFMFFMGMSTDSAVSDGNDEVAALQANTFRSSSFRRKFSEKSLVKPPALNTQQQYEEYNNLLVEYSNLKHLVEQVKGEYESTKEFDFFKRYVKLKGVIKRCLTYMEIGILPDAPTIAVGLIEAVGAVTPTSFARRYSSSATVDLTKTELTERIETVKRSISLLRSQIQIMADKYESSKQFMVFQRYRLMKAMIKELVRDSARY